MEVDFSKNVEIQNYLKKLKPCCVKSVMGLLVLMKKIKNKKEGVLND